MCSVTKENGKYVIKHLGKTLKTKHYSEDLSDKKCQELKEKYYKKPNKDKVIKQIKTIDNGGVKKHHIERYFFKDLMAKTKLHHAKWSIEEMWNCNHLIRFVYHRTLCSDSLYPKEQNKIKHMKTALRLGTKGACSKPTNFPIKSAREIIERYTNEGDNYLDFASGWGIRLLASLSLNRNYFGLDANHLLVERLNELADLYKSISLFKSNLITDIRNIVSEKFIGDFEKKMDLAFTSIPYFNLEDYKIGNQSYTEGTTYKEWLNNYVKPTIKNMDCYLKTDSILAINVSDFKNYNLVNDIYNIIIENNFKYKEHVELKNISRVKKNKEFNEQNNEIIMIFEKEM